jgi:hypothetical protein
VSPCLVPSPDLGRHLPRIRPKNRSRTRVSALATLPRQSAVRDNPDRRWLPNRLLDRQSDARKLATGEVGVGW